MIDKLSTEHRSWNMSRIKGTDTKPEIFVRSFLHARGFRFRLHVKDLLGKPDIVLPKYNSIIFVNGCYWHRHTGCQYAYTPKNNTEFWQKKFKDTLARDKQVCSELRSQGWNVIIVWECEIKNENKLEELVDTLKNTDL